MEQTELKVKATRLLQRLGAPVHLSGYPMLREAVMIAFEDVDRDGSMTELYKSVAVKFGTTPSRVERNLRTTIENLVYSGNKGEVEKLGPWYTTVNSFVIYRLAEELRLEQMEAQAAV